MAFLELHEVVKVFGKNTVVSNLSMNVEKGEFVSFLGGSGCGKTTTLRMIAGFETLTEGSIILDGVNVERTAPNKRNVGMVFQNYALFPNMNVRHNIGFSLKIAGRPRIQTEKRVDEMLELINMGEFASRYPHQLSGGQQQRVALARALAREPAALLLDEPLSALDAKIRVRLRDDIRDIQRKLGITTVYVTHDQEEALSISDRVAVMKEGKIEQIGSPFEIYNRPATPYVASFIGTLNRLLAVVVDAQAGILDVEGQRVIMASRIAMAAGSSMQLRLRPEALSLGPGDGASNRLKGKVENVKFLGSIVRIVVRVGTCELSIDSFNEPRLVLPRLGEEITASFDREACVLAATEPEK
jgi:putative spermidine/putrescine transport system ATP-binding protein